MLELNNVIADNSIDSIVCDPPYELGFMGKSWDSSGVAFNPNTWKTCYNALKSGGYLLAFGGSRTCHRIACAIEDAGFEIRDIIMWIYGSGFPKSMNIGLAIDKKNGVESEIIGSNGTMPDFQDAGKKNSINKIGINDGDSADRKDCYVYKAQNEWNGWGTTLKPAYEPIIVARKPCEGSTTDNVIKYGVGGINIDECRVPISGSDVEMINAKSSKNPTNNYNNNEAKKYGDYALNVATPANQLGRFPSNVILTYDETDEEEVCGGFPNTKSSGGATSMPDFKDAGKKNSCNKIGFNDGETANRTATNYISPIDEGSASRYFYCAKASKRDRDEGLNSFSTEGRNIHPTVKPCELMEYLVRLVTPKGGIVLDPFNGSGSTGKAVLYENLDRDKDYKYIGIELEREYCDISSARLDYVEELLKQPKQLSLFDTLTT